MRPSITILERIYERLSPVAFGPAAIVARATGVSRSEIMERMGVLPETSGPALWFHGASAGEMAAGTELAALLRACGFNFTACYTATNRAGVQFVRRTAAAPNLGALVPWDVRRWVARAYDRWHPSALFLVETELWPQLVLEGIRRGIPVFSVSARIYPRDVVLYRAIGGFIGSTLRRITAILAQNETERRRFLALGADPARCIVAGNLKHIAMPRGNATPRGSDRGALSREALGINPHDRVIVFGSVHDDEIEMVLSTLLMLEADGLRAIVAPRHVQSAAAIANRHRDIKMTLRSRDSREDWRIMILDTMGELRAAYALADLAIVGGGFKRHGGHNPYEPVFAGTPVMFGMHFDHFEDESRALYRVTPKARIHTAAEMATRIREWLRDESTRRRVLDAQSSILPDGAKIGERYASALIPWMQARFA